MDHMKSRFITEATLRGATTQKATMHGGTERYAAIDKIHFGSRDHGE